MKTNDQVVRAWMDGKEATGLNMSTDGERLYSYRLCIGERDVRGSLVDLVVCDYTAPDHFVSATTSQHVYLARAVAHAVVPPTISQYEEALRLARRGQYGRGR